MKEDIVFDSIAGEYRKKSELTEERISKIKRKANRGTRA